MVRFGIIGTNFITDWVLEGAAFESRFKAVALFSRSEERAAEFASKHNIPNIFTSLEEMAASPLIDAVYIASPNACHGEQALLFMKHRKHVLCEKAFARSSEEARGMIDCANKCNVTLMEALKPTLTPNFRSVLDNISKIGKVTKYFASYCQYSSRYDNYKIGVVENAFNPLLSNGATMDIGVYTIYPMVVLFGKPKRVLAVGTQLSNGIDASCSVLFEYDDMEAAVVYSKISDGSLPTQIMGEQGVITLDRINIISDVVLDYRDKLKVKTSLTKSSCSSEYFYEIKEFIDVVESGSIESQINTHSCSLIVMEIMDDIRRQLNVPIVY